MSTMINRVTSSIATLVCSLVWLSILVALPLIEENFEPSGTNDSWQRGLVVAPFVFVMALVVVYHITKKPIQSGYVSFLNFITVSSFYGLLVFMSFGLPAFIILAVFKIVPITMLLTASLYFTVIFIFTQLPPLAIWWLIALRTHTRYSQQEKPTLRSGFPLL